MKTSDSRPVNRISIRKLLWMLMIAFGSICILYFVFGLSVGWGIYFGSLVIMFTGILLIIWGVAKIVKNGRILSSKYSTLTKLFYIVVSILFVSFIFIQGLILQSSAASEIPDADYLLILGAALFGDTPSLELRERLDTSLEYINKNNDIKVIVSGGQGPNENITEAEAMKRYLTNHGVDEKRIIKEDESTSTLENIRFSKEIIQSMDKKTDLKLVIVSNDFHLFRAKLIAKRHGFTAYGLPARTPLWIIPSLYVREYFAVIKSVIFDKG